MAVPISKSAFLWLHVAVHDALRVCGTERVGNLCPDVDGAPIAECPVVLEQLAEAHALDEFGDEIAGAVLLARVVDDDDSRMIEGRDDRRFAMKRSIRSSSNAISALMTLIATSRPRRVSRARDTVPIPPRPISSRT